MGTERRRWSRRAKAALSTLALPILGVGLIGFAHTPAGRPLLGWLATAAGCPMPNGKATPAQREAFRVGALRQAGGSVPATSRPALGFVLEATTLDDARTWADASGGRCETDAGAAALRCRDVPAPAVGGAAGDPPVDDLLLSFGPDGRLVAVDAMRRGLRPDAASEAMATLAAKLERDAGPPAVAPAAPALGAGKLGQASVRFRFSNYAADLSATSLPWSGVMLREQYSSI